jgi:hypothetical protein
MHVLKMDLPSNRDMALRMVIECIHESGLKSLMITKPVNLIMISLPDYPNPM